MAVAVGPGTCLLGVAVAVGPGTCEHCERTVRNRNAGHPVKTGVNQADHEERFWLAECIWDFRERRVRQGARKIFTTTRANFRARFHTHQARLGFDLGPPHILRHGGAAEMIAQKHHPNTVKRRGRWVTDSSLRRYTKTHVLTAQRASLPPAVLHLGRLFLSDPEREVQRAYLTVLDPRE